MLVNEFVETKYLPSLTDLRASTRVGYESTITLYILPAFGERELEDVMAWDIEQWLRGIPSAGAAEKAYKTLRQIIRRAIDWDLFDAIDPTRKRIRLPRRKHYVPTVLTSKQTHDLLRGFYDHELEAVVLCAVTLGLRRGEACALEWRDIDLRSGAVRISKSRQYIRGEVIVCEPKTDKSNRVVYLPRFALALESGADSATVASMLGHTQISTTYEHYLMPSKRIYQDAQKGVERLLVGAQHSISYDTGWVKQWYVAGKIDVRARRIGHTVTVRGESYGGWVVPNGRYDGMTTIQQDMRPSIDIPFDFHASGGAKSGAAAHVGTDGVIEMYCTTDGMSYWGFSVTYLVQHSICPVSAAGTFNSSGWTVNAFNLTRQAGLVTCDLDAAYQSPSQLGSVYATVPAGYRPKKLVTGIPCGLADGSRLYTGVAKVYPDGGVLISSGGIPVTQVFFNASWAV